MGLPHMEHLGLFQIAATDYGPRTLRKTQPYGRQKKAPETHRKYHDYHGVPWNA